MPRILARCALLTFALSTAACLPVAPAPTTTAPATRAAAGRSLRFNATPLDARGLDAIARLEAAMGAHLPDGDYWYDRVSGASGPWGGAAVIVLPPGLPLGGPLRADSSGGGSGALTGVFVNGRELHPDDVAHLRRFMQVIPGRYWVDARGDGGAEGGPALFNLYALSQAAQARDGHTTASSNGTTWVGPGMATSTWKEDSGRVTNDCSYDADDGGMICSKTAN